MWFSQAGPGDWIQSKMESSGTTAPANTVIMANPEQGFATYRVLDATTAAQNTLGAVKAMVVVASATTGFLGCEVLMPHAANAPIAGVVGLLAKPCGLVASAVASPQVEFGDLQVYGYFHDACMDVGVSSAVPLVGEAGTNDLITETIITADSGTGTVTAFGPTQKVVAVALEDDSSGLGDVFLMCI